MKKLKILALIFLIFLSCRPAEKESTQTPISNNLKINWIFQSAYSNGDYPTMPITQISVEINRKIYPLFTDAQGDYWEMDKTESRDWEIPESAISTCFGGWAGLFRCVYIEKTDHTLVIKQAWNDAESGISGWMDVEILKTIPLAEIDH